jgi:hypothetical protein
LPNPDQARIWLRECQGAPRPHNSHYLDESKQALSIVNLAYEHGGIALIHYLDAVREARSVGVNALSGYAQTCLVATLGLLPAAMSHGIGSDSQRPFAIVIVGGLIGALAINIFLLPTLYVWIARDADVLSMPETEFAN